MNKSTEKRSIPADELRVFCSALYQKAGVPEEDADAVADIHVEVDLRGVP